MAWTGEAHLGYSLLRGIFGLICTLFSCANTFVSITLLHQEKFPTEIIRLKRVSDSHCVKLLLAQ